MGGESSGNQYCGIFGGELDCGNWATPKECTKEANRVCRAKCDRIRAHEEQTAEQAILLQEWMTDVDSDCGANSEKTCQECPCAGAAGYAMAVCSHSGFGLCDDDCQACPQDE